MRYRVWVLLVLFTVFAQAESNIPQHVRVAVNAPGSFPYLYLDPQSDTYTGIVVDILKRMEQTEGIQVHYLDSNQLRSEKMLREGLADLYLVNPSWLLQPESVIVSEPIITHYTYLYATKPFKQGFSLDDISGSVICTRKNYVYVGLTKYFAEEHLFRLDSHSDETMTGLLAAGRCDYLIKNNYNTQQVFAYRNICHSTIYQSPIATSVLPLTIVMRPALQSLKPILDRHIQAMTDSGELLDLLHRYSPEPTFPMAPRCN